MVYGTGLENQRCESIRGFKSHPFRWSLTPPPSFVFSIMKMSQLENILCDIDGLIGAALEAGENDNARALVEEFGEWFIEYDANEDIEVTCLEVLSEQ